MRLAAVLLGVVLAGAVALAVANGRGESAGEPRAGSTLSARYADPDGDGRLDRGAGEPLVDRSELAASARPVRQLALFAQLSDAHVVDEESPARLPFLDRLGAPLTSTFRPQEALTGQVLAATVESLNALAPQAVVSTGDLIDNAQSNELSQALSVLHGGTVDPNAGGPGYDGVQSADNPDPLYYRPDVDAPRHAGLLEEAERPFPSPGLRAPWYPVMGNHDLLFQGEVRPSARTSSVATGRRALLRLDPSVEIPKDERALTPDLVDRLLSGGLPGPTAPTPPDRTRRQVTAEEVARRLHGAADVGARGPLLDYSFDIAPDVRGIALDAARRHGGATGRLAPEQIQWLSRELDRAGRRWVVVFSHQPLDSFAGGRRALAVLDRSPRVVAAVAGHTHHNSIVPRRSPSGGYWLVTTAALIDYPQQSRAFRLLETGEGAALETWMVDHTDANLAGVSRELAFLDAQGGRPRDSAGGRLDRNVRLFKPAPGRRRVSASPAPLPGRPR